MAENGKQKCDNSHRFSGLGPGYHQETGEEFAIGGMTPCVIWRFMKGFEAYTGGASKESLRHIVGVSSATVPLWEEAYWGDSDSPMC